MNNSNKQWYSSKMIGCAHAPMWPKKQSLNVHFFCYSLCNSSLFVTVACVALCVTNTFSPVRRNKSSRVEFYLHKIIPTIVRKQCANHGVLSGLCRRMLAPLLYHNRQCFIFFSAYHLQALSELILDPVFYSLHMLHLAGTWINGKQHGTQKPTCGNVLVISTVSKVSGALFCLLSELKHLLSVHTPRLRPVSECNIEAKDLLTGPRCENINISILNFLFYNFCIAMSVLDHYAGKAHFDRRLHWVSLLHACIKTA